MNAVPFDTLKLAKSLKDASFTPEQAEGMARAIAAALRSDLATRADLDGLRRDIKARDAAVGAELEGLRGDIKAENISIRSEISAAKASTRSGLSPAKADPLRLLKTLLGVQTIVMLGAIVGAAVLLLRLR